MSFNGYSTIIHGLTLFPLSKVLPGGSRRLYIICLAQMQEEVHGRPLLGLPQLVLPISRKLHSFAKSMQKKAQKQVMRTSANSDLK